MAATAELYYESPHMGNQGDIRHGHRFSREPRLWPILRRVIHADNLNNFIFHSIHHDVREEVEYQFTGIFDASFPATMGKRFLNHPRHQKLFGQFPRLQGECLVGDTHDTLQILRRFRRPTYFHQDFSRRSRRSPTS